MNRRTLSIIAALAASSLALAACSTNTTPAPTSTTGTAMEQVRAAAKASLAQTSVHALSDATFPTESGTSTGPDRVRIDYLTTIPMKTAQIQRVGTSDIPVEILINNTMYGRLPGSDLPWLAKPVTQAEIDKASQQVLGPLLLLASTQVTSATQSSPDSSGTVTYQVTVTPTSSTGTLATPEPVQVTVQVSGNLVARYEVGSATSGAGGLTMTYDDYGKPVQLSVPSPVATPSVSK